MNVYLILKQTKHQTERQLDALFGAVMNLPRANGD
jgi:hypothetical protein